MRFLIKVPSVVLANLIINENAFPEYLQKDCTPEKLAAGLDQILKATPDRQAQLSGPRPFETGNTRHSQGATLARSSSARAANSSRWS